MTFYFGDSWVFGDELELQVGESSRKKHTFAELVSRHFQARCVNLSSCGSSVSSIPMQFKEIIRDLDPTIDRVFFFLTANHRTCMFDDSGEIKNILLSPYSKKHNTHPYQEQWYKYFDNPAQRLYNYDSSINLLYLWCKSIGVTCHFSNIFTVEHESIIDCTPNSAWLLPKNKCIAEWILPVINPNTFSVVTDDHPDLTDDQWKQQKPLVEQYIRPCYAHPNINGHKKIAQHIIDLLENE